MRAYRRIRRYSRVAIGLHWMVAAGIVFLFVHGFQLAHLEEAQRRDALNLHRSVGVVVFALVIVRICWRMMHPPPHIRMPAVQAWVANYVHLFIYALLVANGLAGVTGWIASGDPVVFFGIPLGHGRAPAPPLTRFCIAIGFITSRALLLVIALHLLAALKHQWVDRDRLLSRMLPGRTILLPLRTMEMLQWARERRRSRRRHEAHCDKCGAPIARKARRGTATANASARDLLAARTGLRPR